MPERSSVPAGSRLEVLRSGAIPVPVRAALAMRYRQLDVGRVVQEMPVPPWLADGGPPALGSLLVLLDSTLSVAVGASVDAHLAPVTSRLHVELVPGPWPAAEAVVAEAALVHVDERAGLAQGTVATEAGHLLATASLRAAVVPAAAPHPDAGRPHGPARWAPGPGDALADVFGLEVLEAADGRARVQAANRLAHGNSVGTLHGGVIALVGHHALATATATASSGAGGAAWRPASFDIDYVRPVPSAGGAIEARAEVAHVGRRAAVASGEVRTPDGRCAALVRLTSEAGPPPS